MDRSDMIILEQALRQISSWKVLSGDKVEIPIDGCPACTFMKQISWLKKVRDVALDVHQVSTVVFKVKWDGPLEVEEMDYLVCGTLPEMNKVEWEHTKEC